MATLSAKEHIARSKLCIALDTGDLNEARNLVRELRPYVGLFKVGKELFTSAGPAAIHMIHEEDSAVFLDLKYRDVPNTMRGAARAAACLGVRMFSLYIDGGTEMVRAAIDGVREAAEKSDRGSESPKIIGVTVLTSIDDNILKNELRIPYSVSDHVLHLAKLGEQSGLDGIVCSAADLYAIKDHLRKDFMYVTPGIRAPVSGITGIGQKRVLAPYDAMLAGSTILVAGTSVTQPPDGDRQKAAYEVLHDMIRAV